MARKGRFLEILVAQLEGLLAPEGIVVTSPEVFRQNGKIIAEIDVTLRGKFGSSEIFVGLECRARPGDGPQGVPWIRDIKGKKDQCGVDKMIAVSTTGFVPGAEDL